jgi:hypothetical protein
MPRHNNIKICVFDGVFTFGPTLAMEVEFMTKENLKESNNMCVTSNKYYEQQSMHHSHIVGISKK